MNMSVGKELLIEEISGFRNGRIEMFFLSLQKNFTLMKTFAKLLFFFGFSCNRVGLHVQKRHERIYPLQTFR